LQQISELFVNSKTEKELMINANKKFELNKANKPKDDLLQLYKKELIRRERK
jgi:hypothetical protein